jgi:hypothetical protein
MNRCVDCCEVPIPSTPEAIYNRPGLTEIDYRVGTYATFRRAMIESIGDKPALRDWGARSDDYGVALFEMGAYIADILTFYQERIANEAFLRTAVHEDTVRRLARRLDYKPAPGAAAETLLAFTLEDDTSIQIPVELLVQSVPGQNEQPQKFETIEAIEASDVLNAAPVVPGPDRQNLFAAGSTGAALAGESAAAVTEAVSEGDPLVIFDEVLGQLEKKEVAAFHERADGRTEIEWTPAVQQTQTSSRVFRFDQTFRLFGYNAPAQAFDVMPDETSPNGVRTTITSIDNTSFRYAPAGTEQTATLRLDATYDAVNAGDQLLIDAGTSGGLALVTVVAVKERSIYDLASRTDNVGDLATALKGQGALTELTVKALGKTIAGDRRTALVYKLSAPEIQLWQSRASGAPNEGWNVPAVITGRTVYISLREDVPIDRLSGRRVFISGNDVPTGNRVTESKVVDEANKRFFGGVGYVELTLANTLEHSFQTTGARLLGNVAAATHGETIADEVLGSGSAQVDFQSFELAKSPVTYTRASGPTAGVDNTLELWVDGILWEETERLYGHGGNERIYTTAVDDESVMRVRFGDGEMGARPTTGDRNITARYRQGLGAKGNVEAHSLQTLLDRPKGLSEVTNPKPATGGADRETREATRENAPNTVRTFDRIVSLRDFEDAARGYVGIAKARADWQWEGTRRTVHLVVASDEGRELSPPEKQNLRTYLDARRDPHRGLQITDYTEVPLTLTFTLQTRDEYRDSDVKEAAVAAVQEFFAFDDRSLGQDLHRSDLYHLLQNVDGVVAVRIDDLSGPGRSLNSVGRLPIAADELAALHPQSPQITTAVLD